MAFLTVSHSIVCVLTPIPGWMWECGEGLLLTIFSE